MKLNHYALSLAIVCLSACTWVEPTKESSNVTLVKSFNVKSCEKLGTTTATVKHQVGPITRDADTVREELITVAKNKAATMGADSIVAKEPVSEGSMSFDIYRCAD
jgi:PBP1b-binding outer membrane lipoprotein LpoB